MKYVLVTVSGDIIDEVKFYDKQLNNNNPLNLLLKKKYQKYYNRFYILIKIK